MWKNFWREGWGPGRRPARRSAVPLPAEVFLREGHGFHPEGPASLTAGEEEAIQFWQHGKILSVLRYIIRYAPNADIRRRLISDLLREPHAKSCFLQPPRAVGPRARLAAVMYANHCYAAMCWLLCLRR